MKAAYLSALLALIFLLGAGCGQDPNPETPSTEAAAPSSSSAEQAPDQESVQIAGSLPALPMTEEEARAYIANLQENDPLYQLFGAQASEAALVEFLTGGRFTESDLFLPQKEINSLADIDNEMILNGFLGVRTESLRALTVDERSFSIEGYFNPIVYYPAHLVVPEAQAVDLTINFTAQKGEMGLYLLSEEDAIIDLPVDTKKIQLDSSKYTVVITAFDCDFSLRIETNPNQSPYFEETEYKH